MTDINPEQQPVTPTDVTPPAYAPAPTDPGAAAAAVTPGDPATAATTDPAPVPSAPTAPADAPAPAPGTPAADVGDVISYQTDPEDESTLTRGLVVGIVEGAEHRDEGLLVVPLPDAFVIPLDAVKD